MTDKQMYKELEKFANDHTLAQDAIRVSISPCGKQFSAIDDGAKYEDVVLLSDIVRGAEHYLMWKRRNKK